MRYLVSLFFVMNSVCIAYSPHMGQNLTHAWQLANEESNSQALTFLKPLISSPHVPNVDKVHYLVASSTLNLSMNYMRGYEECISQLKELCLLHGECEGELLSYYEYSFIFYQE